MLRERLKFFATDVLYYGAGNMLYSLVQFISMPLVVKSLDKQTVADWNILLPTGVLMAALVIFGMDSATVRYLKDTESEKEKSVVFSTGFFFEIILAISLSAIFIAFAGPVSGSLHLSSSHVSSWYALMCWLPGMIIAQYFQNWFKYTFKRNWFLILISIQSAVYLAGILILKFTSQLSLLNVMLMMVASQWLTAFVGFLYCRKLFVWRIDGKLLKKFIAYGLPFMIMAFGFNFIMNMDRYILPGRIEKEDFAVYTQSVRISAIITMVVSSFNFAFGPFSMALLGKQDAEKTFSRFHSYYLILMCFIGLSFIAFGRLIISIFAGFDYISGFSFIPFFVLGYILYGLYSFAQLGIIFSKKSYLSIYVLAAGVATCAVTGLLLAGRYKGYGTAVAFLLANLVMVILANYFSAKYLNIKYHLAKDIFILLLFSAAGYGMVTFNFSDRILYDSITKFAGLAIFLPVISFFLLTAEEKLFIRRLVIRGKSKTE